MTRKTDQLSYEQRWARLFLKIVARHGRVWALGWAIGIIAGRTRRDWDLKQLLARLEDRADREG